jgi:hypothetical protein
MNDTLSTRRTAADLRMNADEFITSVRRRMEDQRCLASEAVDALWNPSQIAPEALIWLARIGAISQANYVEHSRSFALRRPGGGTGAPAGPGSREKVDHLLARLSFEGADGTRKPLLQFDAEDWGVFTQRAADQARSWRARVATGRFAQGALHQHSAASTKDLPLDVLAELEEKVQKW